MKTRVVLSIIIPVLNEAANLPATLARLDKEPDCELIVEIYNIKYSNQLKSIRESLD